MAELAIALAMLTDPLRWLLFAGAGAAALYRPRGAALIIGLAAVVAASVYFPVANRDLSLSPDNEGTFDASFNPLSILKNTKYEEFHLHRFVAVKNEAQTIRLMRKIDAAEADCRILAGPSPSHTLWDRCRQQSQMVSVVIGLLQFSVGALLVSWWRRRNKLAVEPSSLS